MMVKTVFLDAGGVLIHPNFLRMSEALGRQGVCVRPETLAAAEPRAKREMDEPVQIQASRDAARGHVYFNLLLTHAGLEPAPPTLAAWSELRDYHARWNLWENVPGDVVPALDRLRGAGMRLVVVSNANGTLRAHFARLGLAPYFDHILDSSEEGVEKPDPRLFSIALARSGARAETTLHVGDLYHVDVVGARAAGLPALLLDPAGLYADHDCERVASLRELVRGLIPLASPRQPRCS